jgi:hypothetical protein
MPFTDAVRRYMASRRAEHERHTLLECCDALIDDLEQHLREAVENDETVYVRDALGVRISYLRLMRNMWTADEPPVR